MRYGQQEVNRIRDGTDFMSRFIEMLYDMFEKSQTECIEGFDNCLKERRDIIRYDNIIYGPDPDWNTLDIYRPKNREGERLPVIINVHGGGWIYGAKEGYQYYCMALAAKGYAVINMNYRLAPTFCFPSPVEDLNVLIQWLMESAEGYQLNLERIYGVGDSAGAHTLGMYAAICTNEEYAKKFPFVIPRKNVFAAIALNSGVYFSCIEKEKTDFTRILVAEYLGSEDPESIALFDYVQYVNEQYPDTFIMTAERDFVKMQSMSFAKHLAEKSVNFVFRMCVSKKNKLGHAFHCDLRLSEAVACNQEEIDFFETLFYE